MKVIQINCALQLRIRENVICHRWNIYVDEGELMLKDQRDKGKVTPIRIKSVLSKYDFNLVVLVLVICGFGLVMIHSASSYRAEYYYNDSTLYFRRQALFLAFGIVLMVIISLIDYRIYIKKIKFIRVRPIVLLYLICVGLHWFAFFAGYVKK